jgi:hypothetical protein
MPPIVPQLILAAGMFAMLFLLFLVISKASGGIDNALYKLEYMIRKECDIKLESLELKYRMRAADKRFDEAYSVKHLADNVQKASDGHA